MSQLRRFALSLDFSQCTDPTEWSAEDGEPGLGFWHAHHIVYDDSGEAIKYLSVQPLELVKFSIDHPGSETASFGLARYPLTASDEASGIICRPTGLVSWNWRQFCKTQYASLSSQGGWDNFFKIHDGLCRILDEAIRLGMHVEVHDDGKYWENRDAGALRAEVDRWNAMVAAFTGRMKDALGNREGAVAAPITEDPSFEHLEAKGQYLLGNPEIRRIVNPDSPDKG